MRCLLFLLWIGYAVANTSSIRNNVNRYLKLLNPPLSTRFDWFKQYQYDYRYDYRYDYVSPVTTTSVMQVTQRPPALEQRSNFPLTPTIEVNRQNQNTDTSSAGQNYNPQAQPFTSTERVQTRNANSNNINNNNAQYQSTDRFNTKLFQHIGPGHANENVVYSPFSVQTLLSFIYTGTEGNTANELRNALAIPQDKMQVATLFKNLLESQKFTTINDAQLIMANKFYHNNNLYIRENVNNLAKSYFDAEVEATQFSAPNVAAQQINRWVADKTKNHIQNIIEPSVLDQRTQGVLVNAIYFRAKWAKPFSTSDTSSLPFYSNSRSMSPVAMMYNDDVYSYGEFPELQAKVIELPYNNSDLSMMLILPDQIEGLKAMEQKLQNIDLSQLASRMNSESVTLRLPRFRVEFEVDMTEALRKLGVNDLFSNNALLSFFENNQRVGISKVQHKAFIDVNEAGSEAAAATFSKIIPLSLPGRPLFFTADHPFMFAIRGRDAVYFIGHVIQI